MENSITKLQCVECRRGFKIEVVSPSIFILSCKCYQYPVVEGIVLMKRNRETKEILKLIEKGKYFLVYQKLFHLRKRIFYPAIILLYFRVGKLIGFNSTVKILKFLGYNSGWSDYLLRRSKIKYFSISCRSMEVLKQNSVVLDLGCGMGHFFPEIYKKVKTGLTVGLDEIFLSLYMARVFFADKKSLLVAADLEKELPFRAATFNFAHMSDTFQYILNKKNLIKAVYRVLNKDGNLVIVHTHEKNVGNISGTRIDFAKSCLIKSGFKFYKIYNDNYIIKKIIGLDYKNIDKTDAFSVIASKKKSSEFSSYF